MCSITSSPANGSSLMAKGLEKITVVDVLRDLRPSGVLAASPGPCCRDPLKSVRPILHMVRDARPC